MVSPDSRIDERDLVRGLLTVGPLDQCDHPVEERLPRLGGDPNGDLVAQHPSAAGYCRPVTARLPDDRGRLARDRRLVDRGDALDDLAVTGDDVAGRHDAHVAEP